MLAQIYFLTGVIFSFIGPLAKTINHEINETYAFNEPKLKVKLFDITLRVLVLFFFPIWYIILLIDYINIKQEIERNGLKVNKSKLRSIWKDNDVNSLYISEDSERVYFMFFINFQKQLIFGVPKKYSKNKNIYYGNSLNSLTILNKQVASLLIVELIYKVSKTKKNVIKRIYNKTTITVI